MRGLNVLKGRCSRENQVPAVCACGDFNSERRRLRAMKPHPEAHIAAEVLEIQFLRARDDFSGVHEQRDIKAAIGYPAPFEAGKNAVTIPEPPTRVRPQRTAASQRRHHEMRDESS